MTPEELRRIRRFVIKLGKTMHEYGTPSHRLERLLVETTRLLGLEGSFMVTPTTMNFVFWQSGSEDEYTHLARVAPSGIDLNRLAQTHDLAEQVLTGQVSLDQGMEALAHIRRLPDPYSVGTEFAAWGMTSAAFAALCGSGLPGILVALVAGWVVFGLMRFSTRSSRYEEMLEPFAALLIALLASGVAALGLDINVPVVVLAGMIAFIPGLSLTMGLRELAARELVSGTARIMDAGMMLFKLYFGAVFGLALGHLWWGTPVHTPDPVSPGWVHYLAVLGLSISLIVIFKMRPKDIIWGLLAGVIAYAGAILGNHFFEAGLGGLVGALIVGLYANTYARLRNTPSHILLLPGIVLLVPGSKTYVGLNSLISGQDILANAGNGAQVFLSFMAIIAGLIFANVIVPPTQRQ